MNRTQIESDIAIAYHMKDRNKIVELRDDLVSSRHKLDRWFDKYLDMFDTKMNSSQPSDPVWKLYNKKFEVYSDLNKSIKAADYFLGKL